MLLEEENKVTNAIALSDIRERKARMVREHAKLVI